MVTLERSTPRGSRMADTLTDPETLLETHGRTFHGFMLGLKWFCIHLAALLTFLIASFCTPAGWGAGLLLALIVIGVGIYAMNHGLSHSTEEESLHPGHIA
jgi:hypothetical protein